MTCPETVATLCSTVTVCLQIATLKPVEKEELTRGSLKMRELGIQVRFRCLALLSPCESHS